MIDHCTRNGFPPFVPMGRIFRGGARAEDGDMSEGTRELSDGIAGVRASGTQYTLPLFFAWLGEVYAKDGQIDEAMGAVEEGLAMSEKIAGRFSLPEFHRIKGELMLARSERDEAELCFRQAIEIARGDEARSLELRAAVRLARLLGENKRRTEAFDLLAPVYGWFTEGFDTPDLKNAKVLLDDLA